MSDAPKATRKAAPRKPAAKGRTAKPAAVKKETSRVDPLLGPTTPRTERAPTILAEELQPRVDAEAEMLRQSVRPELLPPKRDLPPPEVRERQTRMEREPVDHNQQVAVIAEQLRREEWQRAIEEDEARRGPNRQRNPRLPLMAESQMFRAPDGSEISENAVVPKGHSPKWVGTKDTLSTGNESMMQIRAHQNFGYDYVRDTDGKVIVTELGVLMSATYEDAARRQNYLTPKGSMKTEDSGDHLREVAERENRRAGRRVVGVAELPDHRRRTSGHLYSE